MKKISLFIFSLLFILKSSSAGELRHTGTLKNFGDTTLLPSVLALPLSTYVGKPVDSLFASLPASYTKRGFMPVGIGYAKGVYQLYFGGNENHFSVAIYIDSFQYMTWPNRTATSNWSMALAKLETISYIKIFKNNTCVYGCGNPNYD